MILCKVLLGVPGDVPNLFAGKNAGKYQGKTSRGLIDIVQAAKVLSVTVRR